MEHLIDIILLGLLMITGFAIVRMKSLLAVTMLTSIYSLLSASLFVVLDAVDVALTEAAIGAGISTILMLAAVALTRDEEKTPRHTPLLPLAVVSVTGAALIYGTLDMPHYGDPAAPVHQHAASAYLRDTPGEIGVPNVVTSVLASYRGYDTLGEVTVIFTAGAGVLALLGYRTRRRNIQGPGIRKLVVLRVIAKLFFPLILHNPDFLVDVKLLIILLMTLFISPTASHVLAQAAIHNGLRPVLDKQEDNDEVKPSHP